jgi:putative flippase GtrA
VQQKISKMESRKSGNKHEFLRYLVAGFSAVGTDLLTYSFLLEPMGPAPAKTLSFIAATMVSYTLNKFWTFKQAKHSWREMFSFALLYSVSLLANVLVNHVALFIVRVHVPQLVHVEYQLAWLSATGTSTVLNYIGQKFWVFKKKPA